MTAPVLVTGSGGKLGRVLRKVWQEERRFRPLWQVRRDPGPGDLLWQIGAPWTGPSLAGGVVVHLAGGRGDLAGNVTLAEAVCRLAEEEGAAHVFLASSSAVYAPDDHADLHETTKPAPGSDYGRSKLAMEQALAHRPHVTFLRIGNVFGCDSLIGNARFVRAVSLTPAPGRAGGPMRSYIGPVSFGRVLGDLIALALRGQPLPRVLNFGLDPAVTMAGLLDAAGFDWAYGPPSPDVLARLVLDVSALGALVDLPKADPAAMAAEWRVLGMDAGARA
ncbi:NAD-dependent epimerase/dehydratase family protein [Neogemmobacter tilapiae]|uniref:Epimerase n=1 Tax=Neogemmobacter tilapiae TaxID=875041 RepID=A0A918TKP2_9RHOB|nr:NAD-dependent epimerase/dehydratase family protein [Gemmobacter tilapiae]GHC50451.1 epimerase [Gemmobacter tilapiae]